MQKWLLHHLSLSVNRNYMKNQVSSHRFIICCYEFLDIDLLGITRFQPIFKEILVSVILVFGIFLKSYSFVSTRFPKNTRLGFTRLEKKYSFWLLVFLTSNWQNYSFFEKRVKNGLTSKKKPM